MTNEMHRNFTGRKPFPPPNSDFYEVYETLDAEELDYRLLHTQPNDRHYVEDYAVARQVNDRFATRFYVDRLLSRDGGIPGPVAAAARRQHGQASTQQGQLRRLRRHTSAHVTTLPYVAAPHLGLDEVRTLADELARRL